MNNLPDDMDAALLSGYDIRGIIPGSPSPDSLFDGNQIRHGFCISFCRDKAGNIEDVVYVEGTVFFPGFAEILKKKRIT